MEKDFKVNSDIPPIKSILLLEDDPAMQLRLLNILNNLGYGMNSVVIASCLAEARDFIHIKTFEFMLVDMGLPDGHGKDFVAEVRQQNSEIVMLVISSWSTEEVIVGALKAGASGYLLKERDDFELTLSIRSAMKGGTPIDPFIAKRLLSEFHCEGSSVHINQSLLSVREFEVLQQIAAGLSNPEIATKLFISRHTVESHIKKIYQKLAVASRINAISVARDMGLLK